MATTTPFDSDFEATAARIREVNVKMYIAAQQAGHLSLDAYERMVAGLLDYSQKLADSTHVQQFSEFARVQARIIQAATSAYTQAVRELLK